MRLPHPDSTVPGRGPRFLRVPVVGAHLGPSDSTRAGGGGGGCSAYYGINRAEGGIKGDMGDAAGGGGGGGGWDKHPGGILGGGYDGTNTLAASPGGRGGQTPWRHPPRGGGMGQTPWCNPTTPTRRRV